MLKCTCRFGIGLTMPSKSLWRVPPRAQRRQIFTHRKGITMKKLLTAAIIVMLMACICIGGALFVQAQEGSEESAQHVHVWTYDNNVATCSAQGCPITDATCSAHTADTSKWMHVTEESDTYHYRVCEICEIEIAESKAKCEGGTATCQKGPICTECTTEYGAAVADAHTWVNSECTEDGCDATCDHNGTLSTSNVSAGQHKTECSVCDYELTENCTGGAATCQKGPICTACTTEYGEAVADAHTWVNSACTVENCGATCDHNGTLSTSNVSDGQHKTECSVCDYELTENCTGGTATCTTRATCGECQQEYGPTPEGHKTGDLLQNTELDYHYRLCSVCEQELDVEYCYGGTATCTERAVCEVCENVYGELYHRKDTTLKQNFEEGYHYYSCIDCGAELDVEECHGGTAANCTMLPECAACGRPYGNEYGAHTEEPTLYGHPHDDPEQYHILYYACCDRTVDAEHVAGTAATCQIKSVCAVCGVQYGEKDNNNHVDLSCQPLNTTHHNIVCVCGVVVGTAAHNGGSATCSSQPKCADCGTAYGAYNDVHTYDNGCDAECNGCGETRTPAEHAFGEWQVTKNPTETEEGEQKRVCAVCGETQTATIAAITNPGGSGEPDADGVKTSTVVIIVAAVVVAAAAIGAIVILTKKKKKK